MITPQVLKENEPEILRTSDVKLTGRFHAVKTWPGYFDAVFHGRKPFEIRKTDRDFQIGDLLLQLEYNPEDETFSGRYLTRLITYVFPLPEIGFAVLGLRPVEAVHVSSVNQIVIRETSMDFPNRQSRIIVPAP